ncbi:MAG: hypothetical protein MI749_09230 [Desulfovibrionales bacterium]|nr:hypothetical protein [Desulfovibrionales bacterium]
MSQQCCQKLTPEQYSVFLKENTGLAVVGYLSTDLLASRQTQILVNTAQAMGARASFAVLHPAYGSYFESELKLEGSPTYLLYFAGIEQRRLLGAVDYDDLRELIYGPAGDVAV